MYNGSSDHLENKVENFTLLTEMILCQALNLTKSTHKNQQIFNILTAPKQIFISADLYACETNVLTDKINVGLLMYLLNLKFSKMLYMVDRTSLKLAFKSPVS